MFIDEFFSYLISTNQIDKIVPKEKDEEEKEKQKVKSKSDDKKSNK
ncbi:MAG: hypothetical protein IKG58_03525 [Bacilli bacterium]|nr:hypothetical protein [Bacilli bacterium]MBR3049607.1 hypothetical protein [Bacilli bacterium]